MNCNKCGTPILPGENSCRFCGTVGDFSERKHVEVKPEIIDFNINEKIEVIDFMIGEDEVSVDPEPTHETIDFGEIFEPVMENMAPATEEVASVAPAQEVIPAVEEVAQVVEQPSLVTEETIPSAVVNEEVVEEESIKEETLGQTTSIPVVNAVIEEPATARIPVEEVKKVLDEEVVEEAVDLEPIINQEEPQQEEAKALEPTNEVVVENKEEVKEEAPKKEKNKNSLTIIILTVLLILSIVLNCFLLMGANSSAKAKTLEETSTVSLTTVYSNYKILMPNNWHTNTSNKDFLLVYDGNNNWSASMSFTNELDYSKISDNLDMITSTFGSNQYLFTSDYTKTINEKEVHIFKGKYVSYAVYVIVNEVDEDTVAVTDLKFTGEVDDEILNNILNSVTTVTLKDMSNIIKDEFQFNDITGIFKSVIEKENA